MQGGARGGGGRGGVQHRGGGGVRGRDQWLHHQHKVLQGPPQRLSDRQEDCEEVHSPHRL